MTEELSKEERILRAVKRTLTNIIKDTATPAGHIHPLQDATIENLRQCLALISARERELAAEAGRSEAARPYFTDEPPARDSAVVHFVRKDKEKDKPKS